MSGEKEMRKWAIDMLRNVVAVFGGYEEAHDALYAMEGLDDVFQGEKSKAGGAG